MYNILQCTHPCREVAWLVPCDKMRSNEASGSRRTDAGAVSGTCCLWFEISVYCCNQLFVCLSVCLSTYLSISLSILRPRKRFDHAWYHFSTVHPPFVFRCLFGKCRLWWSPRTSCIFWVRPAMPDQNIVGIVVFPEVLTFVPTSKLANVLDPSRSYHFSISSY